ncbi:hypothetical protein SNE40_009472 [Patella caerulea]|uniref:Uncharacterized protein n=1 Tax=Patella caerulea TaxID=87958 RepID=A0AAN8PYH4_PATCE
MNNSWIICLGFINLLTLCTAQLYSSCNDVYNTEGATTPDGEYVISVGIGKAVSFYCYGIKTGRPQTYVTLKAGRLNNYAMYYQYVGNAKDCGDSLPKQNYTAWGRTEFTRLRIDPTTFTVDLSDYRFTRQFGPNRVCFGCAGDKFSAMPKCPPKGRFKMSFVGTPFAVSKSIQWTWGGKFVDGSSNGQPNIQNTSYIGCFQDHADRLLPVKYFKDSGMTVKKCIQHCETNGFRYAGVEYGSECMCGNSHDKYPITKEAACNKKCSKDPSHRCGGKWKISVYSTSTDQVMEGTCGGYPGYCFPAFKSKTQQKTFQLTISDSQPCLTNVCKNEGTCIALTEDKYKCACQSGYVGPLCDQLQTVVTTSGSDCPTGLQAEQCSCNGQCTGARFDGDLCVVSTGKPKTTCRYDDPGHVTLFNIPGKTDAYCPPETEIVGCSYWDSKNKKKGNGMGVMDTDSRHCSIKSCTTCTVTARCKRYDCGCENNGLCSKITGRCTCPDGYNGGTCDIFDYCSFYEDKYNKTACRAGDCQAVPSSDIKAFGGDTAGDHCIFPFTYNDVMFSKCVEDNEVGPPFACSSYFDGKDDYIDLGYWSPGSTYSIAAWVKPDVKDSTRRTIVGGVKDCRDFGIYIQNGKFMAFYNSAFNTTCSQALSGGAYSIGQWYLVGVSNNGTDISVFVNGKLVNNDQVQHYRVTSSTGLRIGNSVCCSKETFKGNIKAVKIWNRPLYMMEMTYSMSPLNAVNSTLEALYGGLVAHYELGHDVNLPCHGIDHGGDDWKIKNSQELSGIHCNVTRFYVPQGVTAYVKQYDGSTKGTFEVYALDIQIDGVLDANAAGYKGGASPRTSGQDGIQGESYSGLGSALTTANRGGGGGGTGGHANTKGIARPGAGGGYAVTGQKPVPRTKGGSGWPSPGAPYGNNVLAILYLGSGGGSGGNAKDLTKTPPGGRGGNGGGIIGLYASRNVKITGIVSVNGEDGQGDGVSSPGCQKCPLICQDQTHCTASNNKACWDLSGAGGGGSGGSVYIAGQLVDIGHNRVWAVGGKGGYGGAAGCGGDGSIGRIHVDAQTFKGYIAQNQNGFLHTTLTQSHYTDLSIPGQKLINPPTALWGDEVYRGCYQDDSKNRHFYKQVGQAAADAKKMTPQSCIKLCRNANFKFAAVEYGKECFCDNGFDWSLKKSDSDCNMPCSGDKLQYCGAAYRMAIYGPHPQTQTPGHNGVVQKCQPWCVTADADTSDPKWGQCDLTSQKTSSYKIHCQCPAGKMGAGCNQFCQNSTWGLSCRNKCSCNMTTTAECNAIDGSCHCKPGFSGDTCQIPCQSGFFGENCKTQCNCKETEECDPVSGTCRCKDGWTGIACKIPCPPTFFGRNCSQKCNCNQGSCSPEDGTCDCFPGYKLPFCAEMCDPYNYGPNCMSDCDCSNQGCNRLTGVCNCGAGLTGSRCEQNCPHGTWGDGCSKTCKCDNDAGCDGVTGQCSCPPGYVGEACDSKCSTGSYGQDCIQQCPCVANQSTGCDNVLGTCLCRAGFQGNHCEKPCSVGLYGPNCGLTCSCLNKSPCDPVSGKCKCLPGFLGSKCEQPCPDGKYGVSCTKNCKCPDGTVCSKSDGTCICKGGNCQCPPGFYGPNCKNVCKCLHGSCDQVSGQCSCLPGWIGTVCDQKCQANKYGKDCSGQCKCNNGKCDFVDGSCMCNSGSTGDQCTITCGGSTYGVDCQTPCPTCVHATGCNPVNGTCICSPGYLGKQCDEPCQSGFYGDGCKQKCKCSTNGYCNSEDGTCYCKPGFSGPQCNTTCADGNWGPGCINQCDCPTHSTTCDKSTGLCVCNPGFTGVKCRQSCVQGLWGADCSNTCKCNSTTSLCSPLDGACQCSPGYIGPTCDQPCPVGSWGKDCTQTCSCNNKGICDHVTGRCDCLPGYTNTTCDTQCDQDVLWGKNCLNPCNCNGQHCDHRNGLCQCPAGKKGNHCEQDCESNYFGFQCSQVCQCKNGGKCDAKSGECECPNGFTGKICDQSCPTGRYGEGCKLTCSCTNGAACNQATGACSCTAGFMGTSCNISCSNGRWGENCASRCSSSCPVGCLSDTGDCKCQVWSCLNGGTCGQDGRCQCVDRFKDMYCSTSVSGRDIQSTSKDFNFSLSGGAIAGISIGIVVAIVLVVVLTAFIMKRKFMATAGAGQQVKYDGTHQVEIDSGLPVQSTDEDYRSGRGFVNPLTVDKEVASYTELASKPVFNSSES